jgi:glucose-6-phosphate 1-dehydrogenase
MFPVDKRKSRKPRPRSPHSPIGCEVEAEWRIITPIEEAWAHLPAPEFPNYGAGSEGPASWHELLGVSAAMLPNE